MVFYPSSLARGSERSRNGGADRKGNLRRGSGREAEDAAKDSEDSKEFSVEGKGNRKGN